MKTHAPISLHVYNRIEEVKKTCKYLQENYLTPRSEIYIFSDGPKNEADIGKVKKVREYIRSISGFKRIKIIEHDYNKGLANSIISGVSQIIEEYGKVIVLEDDLITSPNFLDFMNQALEFYQDYDKIFSISGYSMDLPSLQDYPKDYYLGYRASSWGWGTWKEQWEKVDWEVSDYSSFKWNIPQQFEFMRGGSDLPYMLWKQMNEKIDSWAIRWCYEQYKRNRYTVYPTISKVNNIGFTKDATHTYRVTKRYLSTLDDGMRKSFNFEKSYEIDKRLMKEFREKFSLKIRLIEKMQRLTYENY